MLKTHRTNRHIWFLPTHKQNEKTKKPIFLPVLGRTNNETNEMYIEKRDKREFWTILAA
jgi:hypothetical protein